VVERALGWTDCDHYFKRLDAAGVRPVLVGGQAINVWAHYFGIDATRPEFSPLASKDIDVLGDEALARTCAIVLNGSFRPAVPRTTVPLSAVVLVNEPDVAPLRLDFQTDSSPNSGDIIASAAVPIPTNWGSVRVMHPLHCLQTRVHNVLDIYLDGAKKYDTPHGLAQLRASIEIMNCFIVELVQSKDGTRKVLNNYESLFHFACSALGLRIWASKGIDVFESVRPLQQLPVAFSEQRLPQMKEQLDYLRA
jgi:hypothetical protein